MSHTQLAILEQALAAKDLRTALPIIGEIMDLAPDDTKEKLLPIIEPFIGRIAPIDISYAMLKADFGDDPETALKALAQLLADKDAVGHGHAAIAAAMIWRDRRDGKKDHGKAIAILTPVAEKMPEAAHMLGLYLMNGVADSGIIPDYKRAAELMKIALESGVLAAVVPLLHLGPDTGVSSEKLTEALMKAYAEGEPAARAFVDQLEESRQATDGTPENAFFHAIDALYNSRSEPDVLTEGWDRSMPPIVVTPPDMSRPEAIAKLVIFEKGQSRSFAQRVTARLYGYSGWQNLQAAVAKGPAGTPDENVDNREFRRRHAYQRTVLEDDLNIHVRNSSSIIENLAPTASLDKPFWAGEATSEERIMGNANPDEFYKSDITAKAFRDAGITQDPASFMNDYVTNRPIFAKFWFDTLKTRYKWPIEKIGSVQFDNEGFAAAGSCIGTVIHDGLSFPVFGLPAEHIPHARDEDVTAAEKRIAETHRYAILHFGSPTGIAYAPPGARETGDAALYMGRMLYDGKWFDVMHDANHDFGGVVAQCKEGVRIPKRPADDFIKRHAVKGGVDFLVTETIATRPLKSDKPEISLGTHPSGWILVMVMDKELKDMMAYARSMGII